MKILVVGPSPTHSKGGMATVIDEIAKDPTLCEKFELDVYSSYIDGNKFIVLLFSIFSFIRFYFTKRNYDVYHIHAASYGSTFRKAWYVRTVKKWNKKVILHIHGAEYMLFYSKSRRKNYITSTLRLADYVIALSNTWKQEFVSTFGLTNCLVVENGINTEPFAGAITDPNNHPKSLLMLGRMGTRKGTYDLLRAIAQVKNTIPDIICYLAGDGERDKVQNYIHKYNLKDNVKIMGWVGKNEKINLLKKSSILVLPSYNEGLPMAILEAMAAQKAIIASNVGAIPEVISIENGVLVNPGDIQHLKTAIIKLCQDTKLLKNLGQNNHNLIQQKFSMNIMHQKIAEIYHLCEEELWN